MKTCAHCGGDLLRHGVTHYLRDPSLIGVRYICRDCRTSFTQRMKQDEPTGLLLLNKTGRPTLKDWRAAA